MAAGGTDAPLVTVAVSVRDGRDWIDGCLKALVAQSWRPLEVVVVDDGSSDGGGEVLEAWHDEPGQSHGVPVRVIRQAPRGLSAGRQAALEVAGGVWVAITDIDVRPELHWIESMMALAAAADEDEDVVAVTGRTVFASTDRLVGVLRAADIRAKYESRPRRASLANGPCSMFLAERLRAIGGFDPMWYHAEDMEVSQRLLAAGGVILHASGAVVHHVEEADLGVFLWKRRRDARGHVRIMRHHPRRSTTLPDHDFLGHSTSILLIAPLFLGLVTLAVLVLLELARSGWDVAWRSPLRELAITAVLAWVGEAAALTVCDPIDHASWHGTALQRLRRRWLARWLLRLWSLALVVGLSQGVLDALFGRHGHRRRSDQA